MFRRNGLFVCHLKNIFFVIIIRFRTSQLHIITHALAFNNKNNSNDPRQAFGTEALWKLLRYIKIA